MRYNRNIFSKRDMWLRALYYYKQRIKQHHIKSAYRLPIPNPLNYTPYFVKNKQISDKRYKKRNKTHFINYGYSSGLLSYIFISQSTLTQCLKKRQKINGISKKNRRPLYKTVRGHILVPALINSIDPYRTSSV